VKLLIIGASGVLGSRLYNDTIKKKWNTMGVYCSHECAALSYMDVRDENSIERIFNLFKPEVVVMAGGITNVDLCTLKPKLAKDVNIKGTLNLVKKIKVYGSKLIYISTDYIFDGENGPYKEDDEPNPINMYGKTKLESENIIKSKLKNYLIVRTAQLYGTGMAEQFLKLRRLPKATYTVEAVRNNNFTVEIIHNMQNGRKVYAAEDFYSTPTYTGSLSGMLIKLIEKKANGTYHGAGEEFIDRYNYVNKIADIFELDKGLIQKVKLKDLKLEAKRPRKGGLRVHKIKKENIAKLYDCNTGLALLHKDLLNREVA